SFTFPRMWRLASSSSTRATRLRSALRRGASVWRSLFVSASQMSIAETGRPIVVFSASTVARTVLAAWPSRRGWSLLTKHPSLDGAVVVFGRRSAELPAHSFDSAQYESGLPSRAQPRASDRLQLLARPSGRRAQYVQVCRP